MLIFFNVVYTVKFMIRPAFTSVAIIHADRRMIALFRYNNVIFFILVHCLSQERSIFDGRLPVIGGDRRYIFAVAMAAFVAHIFSDVFLMNIVFIFNLLFYI